MWTTSKIKDICQVGDGAHASIKRLDEGKLYLSAKNFTFNGLKLDDITYISDADFKRYFNPNSKALTKPKKNDIILGIIGAGLGVPYLVTDELEDFGISSSVALLRVNNEEILPEYLLYWMKGPYFQKYLKSVQGGSAQGFLSLELIRSLPVKYPSIVIQKQIISTLSDYDNLVNNNNQRIRLLEEMAEEIYKEWFVRMRFPGYQHATFVDGKNYKIPKTWKQVKFGDLCEVRRGSSPRPISDQKYFIKGDIPWIKIADATASKMFIYETKEYVNDFGASFSRKLPKGSLIIATSGTLGFSIFLGVEGCIHDGWMYLSNYEEGFTPEFMFYTINANKTYLNNLSYGAAIQNINTEIIRKIPMVKPDLDTLKKFNEIINSMHSKIDNLSKKNRILQQTRDLLLPRLISGKLNIEQVTTI